MSFLNPGLLLGGLLVACPILIHLLNRRRFRIVSWAAMDFLLQAQRRNRRRILVEDLILLLLRCLAVILLALAVARPLLRYAPVVGAFAETRTEHVLLLDDSPSMGQRIGARTYFETVRNDVLAFVQGLAADRPGDSLTLLTTSDPMHPLVSGHRISPRTPGEVAGILEGLPLSGLPARYGEAFEEVRSLMQDVTGQRIVHVLTDARLQDWAGEGGVDPERGAFPNLRALARSAGRVRILHPDLPPASNVAVLDVRPEPPGVVRGVEHLFTVRIANTGDAEADGIEITLTPGDAPPLVAVHDHLAPGESADIPFRVTFHEAGPVTVTAQVGADDLPADNLRHYTTVVPEARRILLLDGDPGAGGEAAETFYLQRALAPGGDVPTGYAIEVVDESLFAAMDWRDTDLLAICNPYRITPEQRKAVETWVRGGGGLLLFLGGHVDAEAWNADPFVPLLLHGIRGDPDGADWSRLLLRDEAHPVLRVFSGAGNPFLRRVHFFRWWEASVPDTADDGARMPPNDGARAIPLDDARMPPNDGGRMPRVDREQVPRDDSGRALHEDGAWHSGPLAGIPGVSPAGSLDGQPAGRVLAHLDDDMESPLLVEYGLGQGRVLVFLTGADAEWSNWPADPSYVITMLEAATHLQPDRRMAHVLQTGETIRMPLDPARSQPAATLFRPGRSDGEGDALAVLPGAEGMFWAVVEGTGDAGIYRIRIREHDGAELDIPFAVNLPPAESDLRPLTRTMFQRGLGDAPVEVVAGGLRWEADDPGGQAELWRTILFLLLGVLFVEQGLAWYFGWRRA